MNQDGFTTTPISVIQFSVYYFIVTTAFAKPNRENIIEGNDS